ncbi:MAG: hypothetical protein IJM76_01425 [Lachnospiraceae bacterium]|nr:hypothetical protein [Lachnospiraceae bacterium]
MRKNKLFRGLLSIILVSLLSIRIVVPVYAVDEQSLSVEEEMAFSGAVTEQMESLMKHWGGGFPDYYGGACVIDHQFVIYVTCNPRTVQNELREASGSQILKIVKVQNSYLDLVRESEEICEIICAYRQMGNDTAMHVTASGVDDRANSLFLEYIDDDTMNLAELKEMLCGYDVTFIPTSGKNISFLGNVTSGVGGVVTNSSTGAWTTIGFCASRTNSAGVQERGFVTAGHAGALSTTMKINGTSVGKISWRVFGGIDAAFVNMNDYPNSGYSRTPILSYNYYYTGTATAVAWNTYVMHGGASSMVTGTLSSTSSSFYYNLIAFNGLLRMNIVGLNGDSGCPLAANGSQSNFKLLLGTCIATDGTYTYFNNISTILSSMNGNLF